MNGARMQRAGTLFLVSCLLFGFACSKKSNPQDVSSLLEALSRARGFEEKKIYYTSGTVDLIEGAVRNGDITKKDRLRLLPAFAPGIKWEETGRKSDGDAIAVKIRYLDHPVENMIGYEMSLRLVRESGALKIDLESELKRALKSRQDNTPADYLKRFL